MLHAPKIEGSIPIRAWRLLHVPLKAWLCKGSGARTLLWCWGSLKPSGPHQHQHHPPQQETAAAPGSGEGCGDPRALSVGKQHIAIGLGLPEAAWLRLPQASCMAQHGSRTPERLASAGTHAGALPAVVEMRPHTGRGSTQRWAHAETVQLLRRKCLTGRWFCKVEAVGWGLLLCCAFGIALSPHGPRDNGSS